MITSTLTVVEMNLTKVVIFNNFIDFSNHSCLLNMHFIIADIRVLVKLPDLIVIFFYDCYLNIDCEICIFRFLMIYKWCIPMNI